MSVLSVRPVHGVTTTAVLVRLAIRRDRVMVAVWLVVLVLVCYASAAATTRIYASEAERVSAAEAINASPGLVALYGPVLDVHSTGELAMTKMTVTYAVLVAIMLLFVVRRHTRLEEETGQTELVAGTGISINAPLHAAVAYGAGVSVVLGVCVAAVDTLGGLPFVGSLAFGASWAGTGLVAVGVTAVSCQIASSARTCAAIAASVIAVFFVARAVGDTTAASWLSWLSPFGWNTKLRAFSDPRWWVLLLYLSMTVVLCWTAQILRRRRDLGAGFVEARPGPATGSPRVRDAVALSLRVHAPMLVWWSLGVAAYGLVFGAISPSFDAFDSPQFKEMLQRIGGSGVFRDTLLSAVVSVLAVVVTCFGVAVVSHAGGDEEAGRTEQVLATATSRSREFAASLLVAYVGVTWLLLVAGVTLAVGVGGDTDHSAGTLVASPLAHAPAVWVVVSLCLLLYAWRRNAAPLGWLALVVIVSLGQLGELIGIPSWLISLSPYTHVPTMPLEPFSARPELVLAGVAAVLAVGAWSRFSRRDIG
jgi:ABC-2 type transport system permease protein